MKTKKPARPSPRQPAPPAVKLSRSRELVWVDSAALRRLESKRYLSLKARIAAGLQEVEHFETVTLPAYAGWHARTFGPLLTRQRELQERAAERMDLMDEVADELRRHGGTEAAAYQRVLIARERRAAGLDEEEPEDVEDEPRSFDGEFRDMMHDVFGVDVDDLSARERDLMEAAFRRDRGIDAEPPKRAPVPTESPKADRARQLYRELVRRLHPDAGGEDTPEGRRLWDDLQNAWEARDVERLELIAAGLELRREGHEAGFARLALGRLRQIVREMSAMWKDVQRRRRELAGHPAAQLARPRGAEILTRTIGGELRRMIRECERDIAEIDAIVEGWNRSQRPSRKPKKEPRGQADFGF